MFACSFDIWLRSYFFNPNHHLRYNYPMGFQPTYQVVFPAVPDNDVQYRRVTIAYCLFVVVRDYRHLAQERAPPGCSIPGVGKIQPTPGMQLYLSHQLILSGPPAASGRAESHTTPLCHSQGCLCPLPHSHPFPHHRPASCYCSAARALQPPAARPAQDRA